MIALLVAAGAVGMAYRWYYARDRSLQRARQRELAGAATALAARSDRARSE